MAIREMSIVDTRKNNVLVVLTNVMSFGNPRHPRKWHSQLRTKSKKIQNLGECPDGWLMISVFPNTVHPANMVHGHVVSPKCVQPAQMVNLWWTKQWTIFVILGSVEMSLRSPKNLFCPSLM